MNDNIRESIVAQMRILPSTDKEVADLTERDKVALAIAAGCAWTTETIHKNGGTFLNFKTVNRIGVAKIDGKFQVFEHIPKPGETISIPLENLHG